MFLLPVCHGGQYVVLTNHDAVRHSGMRPRTTLLHLRLQAQAEASAVLCAVPNPGGAADFFNMRGPSAGAEREIATALQTLNKAAFGLTLWTLQHATTVEPSMFTSLDQLRRCDAFHRWFAAHPSMLDRLEREYAVDFGFALLEVPPETQNLLTAWSWIGAAAVLPVAQYQTATRRPDPRQARDPTRDPVMHASRAPSGTPFQLLVAASHCTGLAWSTGVACASNVAAQITTADWMQCSAPQRVAFTLLHAPPTSNISGVPMPAEAEPRRCVIS